MWQYNYTPNSDDIMHYGVIGMKWGVRKGRNLGESLRTRRLKRSIKANEKDVQSLRKAGYKTEADAVAKVGQKQSEKLKKSQERDKAKADYKQQKQEKKGDKNLIKVRKHNKYARLNDFDEGTKVISKALTIGRENKTKYLELKKKSINDPSITETDSYKQAKRFFESQKKSERVYGKDMTLLQESAQIANGSSWTRKN